MRIATKSANFLSVFMLTDTKIRALKPKDKIQSIRDDRGLFFVITPQGGCGWRFRYRHSGKERMVSLGTYPEVSLAVRVHEI